MKSKILSKKENKNHVLIFYPEINEYSVSDLSKEPHHIKDIFIHDGDYELEDILEDISDNGFNPDEFELKELVYHIL